MGMIATMFEALSGGHGSTTPLLAKAMQGLMGAEGSEGPGLPWLVEQLKRNGFAPHVASWMGDGPNMPISGADLHAAVGEGPITDMAARAGLSSDEFVAKLSEHLPGIVDRLSRDGHLQLES